MKKQKEDKPNFIEMLIIKKIIKSILKKLENMELKGSWRTSLVGWLTLVGVFVGSMALPVLDGNPNTNIDWTSVLQALANAGVVVPVWLIGILSRDRNVSSQAQAQAGT